MPRKRLLSLWLITAVSACASSAGPAIRRECAQCPEMVVIPAGTAIVGAATADPFRAEDEQPTRTFTIRQRFAVSRYEITREQYETFVRATGQAVVGGCLTDRRSRGRWELDAETNFRDPGFAQAGEHPVACVSWEDAHAYVTWLNAHTQGGYRLLTEVEWEYVARAGNTRNLMYPWGDDSTAGCPFGNGFDQTAMQAYAGMDTSGYKDFDPLRCTDGWLNTAPVGSLSPNRFGVYDMIGNVAEWVEDCYQASHAQLAGSGVPTPVQDCSRRIVKGGSWGTLAHNLRIAERVPYPSTHRDDSIGIRVAKTLR